MIYRRREGEDVRPGINWNFYRLPEHSPKTWVFSLIVRVDLFGKKHHFDLWVRRRHKYCKAVEWWHDSRDLREKHALD